MGPPLSLEPAVSQPQQEGSGWVARLGRWAAAIKRDVFALYLAARDPRVPWHAKALAAATERFQAPADFDDRRVEITGPPERKMVINALNSGASVFMADFEDSLCPTWANLIEGQVNLMSAVRRTLAFASPEGKQYRLNDKTAVLVVRPRGWHLPEKHWLRGRHRRWRCESGWPP